MKRILMIVLGILLILNVVIGHIPTAAASNGEDEIILDYCLNTPLVFYNEYTLPGVILDEYPESKKHRNDLMYKLKDGIKGLVFTVGSWISHGDSKYEHRAEIYERVFENIAFVSSKDREKPDQHIEDFMGNVDKSTDFYKLLVQLTDNTITMKRYDDTGKKIMEGFALESYTAITDGLSAAGDLAHIGEISATLTYAAFMDLAVDISVIEELERELCEVEGEENQNIIHTAAKRVMQRYSESYYTRICQTIIDLAKDEVFGWAKDKAIDLIFSNSGAFLITIADKVITLTADIFQFEQKVNSYVDVEYLEQIRNINSIYYGQLCAQARAGNLENAPYRLKSCYFTNKYLTIASYTAAKKIVNDAYGWLENLWVTKSTRNKMQAALDADLSMLNSFEKNQFSLEFRLNGGQKHNEPDPTLKPPSQVSINRPNVTLVIPDSVSAKSTLDGPFYAATNTIDGDIQTPWACGGNETAVGESITFHFNSQNTIKAVYLINGYTKSRSLYDMNSRVSEIDIKVTKADGSTTNCPAKLQDGLLDYQKISIGEISDVRTIDINILGVFNGEKYSDLYVSEVCFEGYGAQAGNAVANRLTTNNFIDLIIGEEQGSGGISPLTLKYRNEDGSVSDAHLNYSTWVEPGFDFDNDGIIEVIVYNELELNVGTRAEINEEFWPTIYEIDVEKGEFVVATAENASYLNGYIASLETLISKAGATKNVDGLYEYYIGDNNFENEYEYEQLIYQICLHTAAQLIVDGKFVPKDLESPYSDVQEICKQYVHVESVQAQQDNYLIPGSDSRYITEADLEGFDAETVRLARNEIFARYGYTFADAALQAYFDGQSWYKQNQNVNKGNPPQLNAYEEQNIQVIEGYEDWLDSNKGGMPILENALYDYPIISLGHWKDDSISEFIFNEMVESDNGYIVTCDIMEYTEEDDGFVYSYIVDTKQLSIAKDIVVHCINAAWSTKYDYYEEKTFEEFLNEGSSYGIWPNFYADIRGNQIVEMAEVYTP